MKSQARMRLRRPEGLGGDFMPRVNGKAFRCHCGGNVFHKEMWTVDHRQMVTFVCNSCGEGYEGTLK